MDLFELINKTKNLYTRLKKKEYDELYLLLHFLFQPLDKFSLEEYKKQYKLEINDDLKYIELRNNWSGSTLLIKNMDKLDIKFLEEYNDLKYYKCIKYINSDLSEISITSREKLTWLLNNINKKNFNIHLYKEYITLKKNEELNTLNLDSEGNLVFDCNYDTLKSIINEYQNEIIELDQKHIQNFVKVNNYLTQKRDNVSNMFSRLKSIEEDIDLSSSMTFLKDEIHEYNLITYYTLVMVNRLISKDLMGYYEIYELFDKLNLFNSKWEDDVSGKLSNINTNIVSLIGEIRTMNRSVIESIERLGSIANNMSKKLDKIDDKLGTNNLLNSIQTYQLYKINKQTK